MSASGLPSCCGRVGAFSVPYANSGRAPELKLVLERLRPDRPLKGGTLHRCGVCDQAWFLDADGKMFTRVPKEGEAALMAWSSQPLVPSAEQQAALRSIGATGADLYGNASGELRFPCAVKLRDGRNVDPALIVLKRDPPIGERDMVLITDVVSIEPSRFALPPAVRVATLHAEEIHMTYAPTRVETRDGRQFALNGQCDLVDADGVAGSELELATRGSGVTLEDLHVLHTNSTTSVYGEWFEGADELQLR